MIPIREFPQSVIEKLNYYVYLLIDPENGQVFYVGKGISNRIFAHINTALKDETPSDKLDKIRNIHANGLKVIHVIHRHGLTEKEALEVEAALIDFVGLSGLTNQVLGHSSDDRGQMTVTEVISKYQAHIAKIEVPAILITVNRLYERGMTSEMLYEATRGTWVIGVRRNKARYAFAVYKGVIREVYEIERWLPAPNHDSKVSGARIVENSSDAGLRQKNRWQFEGKIADDLQHHVGSSTENYQVLGAQNPIRYINC